MPGLDQKIANRAKDEAQAHAPDEHCPVEHLSGTAGSYAAFVARLNGKA